MGQPASSIFGKASSVLQGDQPWELETLCEAGKEALQRGCKNLVENADGGVILASKSCGGTPLRLSHRTSRRLPGGRLLKFKGMDKGPPAATMDTLGAILKKFRALEKEKNGRFSEGP